MLDREMIVEALADSFEDHRLSRSERKGIHRLVGEVLDNQSRHFIRNRAFEMVLAEPSKEGLHWLHDMVKLIDQKQPQVALSKAAFSPGPDCRSTILKAIRKACSNIEVCVFTITDNEITTALIDAHARGVNLRIVTDDDKSQDYGSDIKRLKQAGVQVRMDHNPNHMHHKFALFDRENVLTGSYNWTSSAWKYNRENVVLTSDEGLVAAFIAEFDVLWRQFA